MKEMIIKIAPFVLKQTVYITDKDTDFVSEEKVPQKELASYISLHENEVQCVHLFGKEEFVRKIQEECLSKYSVCKCDFKINK